ncbi:hypothetical protein GCM10010389_41990 [Streptomyces echinoruber]|uniref:Uncharacterized protein n=1 Tax=Streptomyces echinoruber TaxID=68898 RepID=A0A918RGP6_9ACTN|nr:hypothetical protein GCM10010389_41990 [Streptomyces echinoruber]
MVHREPLPSQADGQAPGEFTVAFDEEYAHGDPPSIGTGGPELWGDCGGRRKDHVVSRRLRAGCRRIFSPVEKIYDAPHGLQKHLALL